MIYSGIGDIIYGRILCDHILNIDTIEICLNTSQLHHYRSEQYDDFMRWFMAEVYNSNRYKVRFDPISSVLLDPDQLYNMTNKQIKINPHIFLIS